MSAKTMRKLRRRILIITSSHPDFDSRVWKHTRSVVSMGYEVSLICPWNVRYGTKELGVTFLTFSPPKRKIVKFVLIPIIIMVEILKLIGEVDIIHFHDIDILPVMSFISLIKPVVYDIHENYHEEMLVRYNLPPFIKYGLSYLVKWGQYIFAKIIKNLVLVVPFQDEYFPKKKFNIIHLRNYASVNLLDNFKNDYLERNNIVIFIGSQHINNGSLLLLDIIERAKKRGLNTLFYISERFGRQKFHNYVISEIKNRNIFEYIKFIPNVLPTKIMSVLNMATIAISPNLRVPQQINGIHTKLFEYMAAGLPIIASDLPHQIDVLKKWKAGILAKPENVDSFVDAIEILINDRKKAMQIGKNGQKAFIKEFNWEKQSSLIGDFYSRILNGNI